MSNIEKIKAEIERRKGYISVTHFAEELLSFIDSLSEEPDKSLNEEIKKEMVKLPFFIRGKDQIAYARHFYELGKNSK